MPIDVKYNPFDHMNAVTDPALFIGREEELAQIDYYFQQSRLAPRSFHLAILGERGSGKTSLLNMAERSARERGFCVARINLNERNVSTPLQFLFKIFNSIIESAIDEKRRSGDSGSECFGGRSGDIYNKYIDTITTYNVPPPADRTFTFPVQYAMAMAAGREDAPILEDAFQADLQKVSREIGTPIALLFDECNLLADKRADLQMLRNIFMNSIGYMLVFSGTPNMFPIMNDVFSPIARQFKKIEVAPFEHMVETKRAISVPLKQIGLEPGLSSLPRISPEELDDIHQLTGGKPHEIQLLCHCMIRQMQNGRKTSISLDVELLDEVLLELRQGIDIASRPVISAIRQMDEKDINEIALFMQASDATFEQYEFIETAFKIKDRPKVSKKALDRALEAQILRMEGDKIVFNGDDFDKVYCRYYAIRRGAKIYFNFLPVEIYFKSRMVQYLHEEAHLDYLSSCDPEKPFLLTDRQEVKPQEEAPRELRTFHPIMIRRLFFANFEAAHCGVKSIQNYYTVATWKGLRTGEVLIPSEIRNFNGDAADVTLRNLKQRLEILGGTFTFGKGEVKAATISEVEQATHEFLSEDPETEWEAETEREFFSSFMDVYTERHDVALARAYADALSIAFHRTTTELANNIGYFYMAVSEASKASAYLERAVGDENGGVSTRKLATYNLAVLRLKQFNIIESRALLEKAKELQANDFDDKALCLLIPEIRNKRVILQEKWNPKYKGAFRSMDHALSKIETSAIALEPIEIILETQAPA